MSEPRKKVVSGNEFMVKWAEALKLPPTTCRVVIDAEVGQPLIVYISLFGDKDLLKIEPPDASDVKIVIPRLVTDE